MEEKYQAKTTKINRVKALAPVARRVAGIGTPLVKTGRRGITVSATRETAVRIADLYEQWCKAIEHHVNTEITERMHGSVQRENGKKSLNFAQTWLAPTPELAALVDGLIERFGQKRNYIIARAIERGVKKLPDGSALVKAYPGLKPSVALVSLRALQLGLPGIERVLTPRTTPGALWANRETMLEIVRGLAGEITQARVMGVILEQWPALTEQAKAQQWSSQVNRELGKLRDAGILVRVGASVSGRPNTFLLVDDASDSNETSLSATE